MNTFLNPQEWSGKSTLQVVDQLAANTASTRTTFSCMDMAGGGDFVNRFARWAPERVAAVSSHSTVGWDYYEVTPGLHPLGDLKNIAQLLPAVKKTTTPSVPIIDLIEASSIARH